MFTSNQPYITLHPTYMNKPVPTFHAAGTNKENQSSFTFKKTQNHQNTDSEPYLHHNRPKGAQPLGEIKPIGAGNAVNECGSSSIYLGLNANKGISVREDSSLCRHVSITKYQRAYCKECSLYFPKSGAETYKEKGLKQKIDSHPDEVYKIMLESQKRNRDFVQGSSYVKDRKILVEWIYEISEDLKFFCDTVYIAISYFDTVLSKVLLPKNKLQLVCLSCLIVAAKFSEMEEKIPSYKELYEFCRGSYSIDLFKRSEMFVLETLGWNLKTITPFQFIQFYLSKGCTFSSDQSVIRDIDSKLLRYLRKYSEFFVDISMHDYDFNSFQSHIVACSAISAARKAVGLFPFWSPELEELCEVTWDEIESCFNKIYRLFEESFPEIASKANSYSNMIQKTDQETSGLDRNNASMSIENVANTPFKQPSSREQNASVYDSSKKEKAPSPYDQKSSKKITGWALSRHDENSKDQEKKYPGIKMVKRSEDNQMNIENVCEELIKRDNMNNKVKRNLVF